MNINKDNYEEYFLLFADNELSAQEKSIVEDFVRQHADLQEEFLNIKQAILTPENDLKLEGKSSLFQHTKKFINHSNYKEAFVLYNDNELNSAERNETEAFLSENPSLKKEFEVFKKLKLQPDNAIVFPNRKLLFKREDGGKVIPFRWWKAVAAAILLGMGILTGIEFQKKNKNELPGTVNNNIPKKHVETNSISTDTAGFQQVNVIAEKKREKHSLKQKQLLQKNTDKLIAKSPDVNQPVFKNRKQTNNLPEMSSMVNQIEKEKPNLIVKEILKNNNNNPVKKNNDRGTLDKDELQQDEIASTGKKAVPDALPAAYTSDGNENSNNYAFYNITEERFNKSKIGSFLHKVKRVIERKISPLNNSKNQREVAVN
ncbi:MAG: hypothetical protein ABIO55_01330 [Ginsengibacter sp.]